MAKRLKTSVYAESPTGAAAKVFGPQDKVEDIPQWAKDQWGDHVYEEFDPSQVAAEDPTVQDELARFRKEADEFRADNEDLRAERDKEKARSEELQAQLDERDSRIAELQAQLDTQATDSSPVEPSAEAPAVTDDLESKNVDELKVIAKDRGIEGASSLKRAELLTALRGQ